MTIPNERVSNDAGERVHLRYTAATSILAVAFASTIYALVDRPERSATPWPQSRELPAPPPDATQLADDELPDAYRELFARAS